MMRASIVITTLILVNFDLYIFTENHDKIMPLFGIVLSIHYSYYVYLCKNVNMFFYELLYHYHNVADNILSQG